MRKEIKRGKERAVQNVQELGTSKWCAGEINRAIQWDWLSGASVNGRNGNRSIEEKKKEREREGKKRKGGVVMSSKHLITACFDQTYLQATERR